MIRYVFKEIAPIQNAKDADPQAIGEALEAIAEANGGELLPSATVEAARKPKHVLHKHFEWDDSKAAESWRLEQARGLIRCIRVLDDDETPSPAFLSVSDKGGTSYRTSSAVRNSVELQTLVLAQAERDLEAFELRYRTLLEVCDLVRKAKDLVRQRRSKLQPKHAAA